MNYFPGEHIPDSSGDRAATAPSGEAHGEASAPLYQRMRLKLLELEAWQARLEVEQAELAAEKRALVALAGAQRRKHEDWQVARLIWCLVLATGTVILVLAAQHYGRAF